ncbi:hypothetical protein QTO34_006407 [Cnephaeus nilssonii]|uniref:Uncharacterized protein n=1 Tax=Cnephaeus nilssonii TaxID=3371016 RepID=A0AA40HKF7_CNENI|nr:hypothetical protein QTO34_006407 [Eptesicus nilssonii]
MDKAAVLDAKSEEKGVPGNKPVVGKKGKKAVGVMKQKKPLVGKKATATKNFENSPMLKETYDETDRAAAPLSQHRSRGHGLVGAAATAVAAAADSAQRLSVKEETIFLRDGPTRVTDPTELPTEILGGPRRPPTPTWRILRTSCLTLGSSGHVGRGEPGGQQSRARELRAQQFQG